MFDDFTIIGDPHSTLKNLGIIRKLFLSIEELGRNVIILGDLLDTKSVIRSECLNLYMELMSKSKLQFIILVGNHDYHNLQCQEHSLKSLSFLPNVTVIDKVTIHPNKKFPFIFFPYIHDKAKLKELLQQYSGQDLIAFGHFEVSGFDFGNGHICEDATITYDDFSGYKRVISGHFHKYQQKGNFTYLGTPFSHSFGEANQDKVIGHYQLSTDTLTCTPTDFPRHISMKLDCSKKGYEKKLQDFLAGEDNNLIRIQLHGSPEDVSKLDKSKYVDFNIKWEDKSNSPMDSKVNLDETLDNKTQFREWAQNIKNLDIDTVTLGLSILEAVGAK